MGSRDSSVGIATWLRAGRPRAQTGAGAHTHNYPIGTETLVPGDGARVMLPFLHMSSYYDA